MMFVNQNTIRVTRKQLYEQVWSISMVQLAKRYGLSDVGLAKICKKNNIPRPGLGYWAKKQAGKNVKKTPLLNRDSNWHIVINSNPLTNAISAEKDILVRPVSSAKRTLKKIIVPEILTDPHPLVEKTLKVLEACQPDGTGVVDPPQTQCLKIKVSKHSIPRALRIMDALIKALIDMGFEITVTEKATYVNISYFSLSIAMGEILVRRRIRAQDHNLDGYYKFGYNLYKEQPVPTGRLFLIINSVGVYLHGGYRQNWRDTESKRLEDLLPSFVSGLMKVVTLKKAHLKTRGKE